MIMYIYIYIHIYVYIYIYIKRLAWEDQSKNQCYIHDVAPKTHLECYIAI